MTEYTLKKLPKNTFEIVVVVPWSMIQEKYGEAFEHELKELAVEGFRKGKVPHSVAEKHLQKEKLYQHAIEHMVPSLYEDIVKKEDLKPVLSPKIELTKAKENEDWELLFKVAGKPTVSLGDYKKAVQEVKAKQKKAEIWVPGKDGNAQGESNEKKQAENQQKLLNEILESLLKQAKIEISDLILEEELNARLARLVDEVQKIGLTVESYLKSKNLTMEALRAQLRREIEDTHRIEFILNEIAETEKIQVDQKDLDKLFEAISDPKERAAAGQNSYVYASLLRKQKTLDFLTNL